MAGGTEAKSRREQRPKEVSVLWVCARAPSAIKCPKAGLGPECFTPFLPGKAILAILPRIKMTNRIEVMFRERFLPLVLAIGLAVPVGLFGQNAQPAATGAASQEEKVTMSPFSVTDNPVTPYQASEVSSGARVAVNLFDLTQSASVVTNATIKALGAEDLLSATVLMAGVSNNSQPYIDRLSIRGFQVNNAGDVDGFYLPPTGTKMDDVIFDRIELVRGPSAVLTPAASPGGTMNIVTKVAEFHDFGSVSADVGEYNTDRYSFDINRVQNHFAYRLVAGYANYTQGDNQGYHQAISVVPSLAWQLGPNSQLVVQYLYRWAIQFNGLGFPIDPSVGPNTPIKMLSGMNIYQSGYADNANDPSARLEDNTQTYRILFTSNLTDAFSMRVAGRVYYGWESYNQWNLLGNAGGAINPFTGMWTPGIAYGPAPTFSPGPAAPATGTYQPEPIAGKCVL